MYFEEIECCSLIIFSFFNLHELCKYKTTLWNKAIQESLGHLLFQYKTNHLLYDTVLSKHYTANEIYKTPILFFTEHYLCQNIYHDFKHFLFQTLKQGNQSHFYLATRQFRLFFIHRMSPTSLVIFTQLENHSIFYTIMVRIDPNNPTDPTLTTPIETTGYIFQNNHQLYDDTFILSLLYRNE